MKKALLSLAAVIGMGFAANADVVSLKLPKVDITTLRKYRKSR